MEALKLTGKTNKSIEVSTGKNVTIVKLSDGESEMSVNLSPDAIDIIINYIKIHKGKDWVSGVSIDLGKLR